MISDNIYLSYVHVGNNPKWSLSKVSKTLQFMMLDVCFFLVAVFLKFVLAVYEGNGIYKNNQTMQTIG